MESIQPCYAVRAYDGRDLLRNELRDTYTEAHELADEWAGEYGTDTAIRVIDGSDLGIVYQTRGYQDAEPFDDWEYGAYWDEQRAGHLDGLIAQDEGY